MGEQTHWNWRILQAGTFKLDGGSMFGIIPKAMWSKAMSPDTDNRITLQTNCLLLEGEGRRVLIETGYGDKFDDKHKAMFCLEDRSIVDALQDEDIDPHSITDVILTHLHFDHAGGLSRVAPKNADPQSSFPHADVYVQRKEWDDANANRSTMSRTYSQEHFSSIANKLKLVNGAAEILPGIQVIPVPGHTWGQQAILFHDSTGPVLFPGDVMPTVHHAGLPYNMAYDVEPYTNMQTKSRLFEQASAENWRWVIDHEPDTPVVTVHPHPKRVGAFTLSPVR